LPMWRELLDELGVEWLPLFCVRHPLEVARSLADRDGLDASQSHAVWLRHMVEAGIETQRRTRGVVSYEALLSDWRGETARIAETFAIRWPDQTEAATAAIEAFLESGERHHHEPADKLGEMPEVVAEAYEALLRARTSGDGWRDFDRLNSQIVRFSNAYDQAMQDVLWDRFRPRPELLRELKDTLDSQKTWFNVITAYWLERRERDEAFDTLRAAYDMQASESARAHAANASLHEMMVALRRDETRLIEESARAHADNASLHELLEAQRGEAARMLEESAKAHADNASLHEMLTAARLHEERLNESLAAERARYAELDGRTRSLSWLLRRLLNRAMGRG
jgi:chromosome segregation ATPase